MNSRLIVVPARFGSKGIPRKVTRSLGRQPLIWHVLSKVSDPALAADVVVSTDDPVVRNICAVQFPRVTLLGRGAHLCDDQATLDQVVVDCVQQLAALGRKGYATVITVQPTSPLITVASLQRGFALLESGGHDSVISVKNDSKLRWSTESGTPKSLYKERKNRQFLPPEFAETGGLVGCTIGTLARGTRIGTRPGLLTLGRAEAIDIDDPLDWQLAEAVLAQRRIAFVVVGSVQNGMGHVYRAVTLAGDLAGHDVRFFCASSETLAIDHLRERNYPVEIHGAQPELFGQLEQYRPHVIVNDCLDTSHALIAGERRCAKRVVCFEDMGVGALAADAVINELYPPISNKQHIYCGPEYACLRDEFYYTPLEPRGARNGILVSFGGADESNLTLRCLQWLTADSRLAHIPKTIILGRGYGHGSDLEQWLASQRPANTTIVRDTPHMATYMTRARVGVCSGGRTVYEFLACETPVAVICQNTRELTHLFLNESNGVRNFGLLSDSIKDPFIDAILHLHDDDAAARLALEHIESRKLKAGRWRVRNLLLSDGV